MPLRVINNISSTIAQRALSVNNARLGKSVERISSGIRIKKSADDGAGFQISQNLGSDAAVAERVRAALGGRGHWRLQQPRQRADGAQVRVQIIDITSSDFSFSVAQ